MSNYECMKCGAEANSKCAASRNVFITDETVGLIGNLFTYEANRTLPKNEQQAKYDNREWVVTLKYRTWDRDSEQDAIQQLIRTLTAYPAGVMKQALCDHSWKLMAPKCELGCCTRPEPPLTVIPTRA